MIGSLFVSLIAIVPVLAPIAPNPPPSPRVIVMPPRNGFSRTGVTQTIAVQVRQDAHILWSGELTRSSIGGASFNQDMRESRGCPITDHVRFGGGGSISTGLSVSISPDFGGRSDVDADDSVQIMVSRTRPLGGGVCTGDQSSSTVRFSATTKLVRGRAVSLAGEGGLTLVLTLR